MMNLVLAASLGAAVATSGNQHNWQQQNWQWKYPAHPKQAKNAVIAAFYKDDTCSGPVTVLNTAERACQALPKNTYNKWWNTNEVQKVAYADDSYSGSSWSSGGDSSSSSAGRRLSNDQQHSKHYADLSFSHYSPVKEEGYFTVLCNKRQEHDYDWHTGWDHYSSDSSSSSSSNDSSSDSSSSSSDSSSSTNGVTYRHARGYWSPRPVGGRVLICKDSHCSKCREAIWFQPLQCIAQQHYGWDYLCRGYKKHHTCGFAGIQAVCAPVPEAHLKPVKVTKKKDDSSSSSAE